MKSRRGRRTAGRQTSARPRGQDQSRTGEDGRPGRPADRCRQGFLDAWRGRATERVHRQVNGPLVVLPAVWNVVALVLARFREAARSQFI